jgi:hypothetical protein
MKSGYMGSSSSAVTSGLVGCRTDETTELAATSNVCSIDFMMISFLLRPSYFLGGEIDCTFLVLFKLTLFVEVVEVNMWLTRTSPWQDPF